jgi:hypothetical protein
MPYFDALFIIVTVAYISIHLFGVFSNLFSTLKTFVKNQREKRSKRNKNTKAKKYSVKANEAQQNLTGK